MVGLVADVGGTNTRLALVRAGEIGNTRRLANDAFPDFQTLVRSYLAGARPGPLTSAAIAVAGPVSPEGARLTNRDWHFCPEALAATLGGAPVRLVNDLAALGHAIPALGKGDRICLHGGQLVEGGQALVAGLGTGFNVSLSINGHASEAEYGHAALPHPVAQMVEEAVGDKAAAFHTGEDVVSGRGFPDLHEAMTGERLPMDEIVRRARTRDPVAKESMQLLARMAGAFAREMILHYMPRGGLYFAGSVARTVFDGPCRRRALEVAHCPGPFEEILKAAPIYLITEDAAALRGLARLIEA